MAVTKRTRYEVLKRDNHRCRYCGESADERPLTIDHVVPVALGGSDKPGNLVAACRDCNAGKSSSSPDAEHVAQVADDAVRWARARNAAMTEAASDHDERHALYNMAQEYFLDVWNMYTFTAAKRTADLPADWTRTINRWARDGVNFSALVDDAVEIAMFNTKVPIKSKYVYFIGIMQNKLTAIDARAQEIARGPIVPSASYNDFVMGALSAVVDRAA